MKIRYTLSALTFSLAVAAGVTGRAGAVPAAPEKPRELTIVVVEALSPNPDRLGIFDKMDIAFTKVFTKRKWPVTIKWERFAANSEAHDLELQVFYKGIHEETSGDQTFRAWMILNDHGTKTDFGIIRFQYYRRAGETTEDMFDHVLRGAAAEAADKVEAVLFPKAAPKT